MHPPPKDALPSDDHTAGVSGAHSEGYSSAAASGSIWTTLQTVLNKVVTVVATWGIARLLSPEEVGVANIAVSIGAFLFILAPFAMGDVLLAEARRFDELAVAARRMAWTAGWCLFVLLVAVSVPIERWRDTQGLALPLCFVALRPLADAVLVVHNARMRLDLEYRRMAKIDGLVTLGATLTSVLLAFLGAGPVSIVLPPIAALAVRGWIYKRICRRLPEFPPTAETISIVRRRFLIAGLGQYAHNVVVILEPLVLWWVASEVENGFFALAFQLAVQANVIIAGQVAGVLQPIFSHLAHDPNRQVEAFLRATRLLSAIAVPASLLQAAFAAPIFALLFEEKWIGSIAPFMALSIGQAFYFVATPCMALLKAQGRFGVYLTWQIAQLVISVVLFFLAATSCGEQSLSIARSVGIPVDDSAGAVLALAMASSLVWAISCPVVVYLCGRPAGVRPLEALLLFIRPWSGTLLFACLGFLSWPTIDRLVPAPWSMLMTIIMLGPLCFGASVFMNALIDRSVRGDFSRIVGRLTGGRLRRGG